MKPEEVISPWRNAKPRKPLSDFNRSPGGKSPNSEKGPLLSQSPPNSGFKESTRMESPANSSMKSDMSGASPSFFRGEDVKRGSKKKSDKSNHNSSSNDPKYTKLRLTPLQKKNKAGKKVGDSDSECSEVELVVEILPSYLVLSSQIEDDQPSGSCQFVGESSMMSNLSSSTINNSTMGKNNSIKRRGNNSVKLSQSVTSPAITSKPSSTPVVSKTKSVYSCFGWVLLGTLAIICYSVFIEGQDRTLLFSSSPDTKQYWSGARDVFRTDLRSLVTKFPNQSSGTWKMVSATLKSPMSPSPDYPGVLVLLSTPSSLETANCLAMKLVELASKSFSKPGLHSPSSNQLVISSLSLPSVDPLQAKEELTSLLHSSLSSWGATAITHLHHLHPVPALTLHAFADNTNAPYKQAAIILSVSDNMEGQGMEVGDTVEKRVESILAREWNKELGEDKLYALISRLVVSVAEVKREDGEVMSSCRTAG